MNNGSSLLWNINGNNSEMKIPTESIIYPMHRYRYPKTDIISLISNRLLDCNGLKRKKLMQLPIPSSAKFMYPRILLSVPCKPMNSAPKFDRNTFLEKKDKNRVKK